MRAEKFATRGVPKARGLLFEMRLTRNDHPACADVAWLSTFPEEKEVLISPWQKHEVKCKARSTMADVKATLADLKQIKSTYGTKLQICELQLSAPRGACREGLRPSRRYSPEQPPPMVSPLMSMGALLNESSSRRAVSCISIEPSALQMQPVIHNAEVLVEVAVEAEQHARRRRTDHLRCLRCTRLFLSRSQGPCSTSLKRRPAWSRSTLHWPRPWGRMRSGGWVDLALVSSALFGELGLETLRNCSTRFGPFVFAAEFANVHTTWRFDEPSIVVDDERYPSVEHYFQVMKSTSTPQTTPQRAPRSWPCATRQRRGRSGTNTR